MSAAVGRAFGILELLAAAPGGLSLGEIASRLDIPASATHRLLNELVDMGYMRQSSEGGDYALSMKLTSVALSFLSEIDLVDQAKPSVDRLAAESKCLARLGIVDDDRLIWVLKAQGSTSDLRYEPPLHQNVQLAFAASGHAWLSQLSDEEAMELVFRQGLPQEGFGSQAPRTVEEVLGYIRAARKRGYAVVRNTYDEGITAVSVPIVHTGLQRVTGVLSVAGLGFDLTDEAVERLVPVLRREAAALADARLDFVKYLQPTHRVNPPVLRPDGTMEERV